MHQTGCPSIDIAAEVAASPAIDFELFQRYGGVGPTADLAKGYLVVMQHPVTTEYDEARRQIDETLYAIKDVEMPVLWFWPNPDAGSDGTSKGIRVFRENVLASPHFGAAGLCGSIGWAQFRTSTNRTAAELRHKAQLSRKLGALQPYHQSREAPRGLAKLRYQWLRHRVPHRGLDPQRWRQQVQAA